MNFCIRITHLLFFLFLLKLWHIYAFNSLCEFNFRVNTLHLIYDKYNGKEVNEVLNSNKCENLESLSLLNSFWMLKLKSLCTEKTSILDKHIFDNICSQKFTGPHVKISGVTFDRNVYNIEFFCAHFLYNNNKDVIKCVKDNYLNSHLDSFHIAFDLSISQKLLKKFYHIDFDIISNSLNDLNVIKKIMDDSLCRIHYNVHIVMSEYDYQFLKALVGLCTKLGFHNHFIITDNIYPLFNPLNPITPNNISHLDFKLKNSSMYYENYKYYLYVINPSYSEFTYNSHISPSILMINQSNSFITWIGLNKDNYIYDKKFNELYKLLKSVKYIERITFCYSKYTSKYYEKHINDFLKYISENQRDIMQNNPDIYIFIIKGLCKDIQSVHKCVENILSLDGIYDYFFKNFIINFIYYNVSCVFNCNSIDLRKLYNDDALWDIILKYFSHKYLMSYKKKIVSVIPEDNYKELSDTFYQHFDYEYIHSGKWRTELNLNDEKEILTPSNDAIEYEFYNFTYHLLDLSPYNFLISDNKISEDQICNIAFFIEENGKKYVRVNKSIKNLFSKNNKRLLSSKSDKKNTMDDQSYNNENADPKSAGVDITDWSDDIEDEEDDRYNNESGIDNDPNVLSNSSFMNGIMGGYSSNNFMNMFKNIDLFNNHDDNNLLGNIFNINQEKHVDKEDIYSNENFNIEDHKISTSIGDIYPLKSVYNIDELQAIYKLHPNFSIFDHEIRESFFRSNYFSYNGSLTVKNIPTKIPNFYKYFYEIKKKLKKFNKNDEDHYNLLIKDSSKDPDIFSKMDITFKFSKSGKWPIRSTSGRWISKVLCECFFGPQLVYNPEYLKNKKGKEDGNDEANLDSIDTNKYLLKDFTQMIGIEFEDEEPYRCAVSYLGNEKKKNNMPVSSLFLIQAAIGFCVLHGFKIIWVADSAFDIHTNIYLRHTSILEKKNTYYELNGFELYGSIRLIPNFEYVTSGINIENNIVTTGTYILNYNMTKFPGMDLKFQLLMTNKVKDIIYDLKFDCHHELYKGCYEYYPLMRKNKKLVTKNYNAINLLTNYTNAEKERIYQCSFMHDKTFIELNKIFPKECTYGSRIGDCHIKVRKNIPCYDQNSCKYLIYIYNEFLKPRNNFNLLHEHFMKISENLSRLARPYYLQSIVSLEHDIQVKKNNKEKTEYEEILLFVLKNSVFYITWVNSSEYWKRAIYVQDFEDTGDSTTSNKELFCPVAYSHEFVQYTINMLMKFPNK